jgi:hypothetical protein
MRSLVLIPVLMELGACTTTRQAERRALEAADWRSVVTPSDAKRLREWRGDFSRALARARAAGHGAEIDAAGPLLTPDAGVPGPLPNGDYRCRIVKLGATAGGLLDYVAYPPFACRVRADGPVQSFAKLGGSQRPVGRIYRAGSMRSVFLGVLVLGDEARPMRYGSDPDRSLAGWVERIGDRRWRIILPAPRLEAMTDVIEIVPAT